MVWHGQRRRDEKTLGILEPGGLFSLEIEGEHTRKHLLARTIQENAITHMID
jgi:hypothetical protein